MSKEDVGDMWGNERRESGGNRSVGKGGGVDRGMRGEEVGIMKGSN